ncbi:integrase core domain-containing protein [Streptomyces sp. NPDC005349]|uniref:integrase core domain-containing protein n=1 Tax=Streptomyces sp. NPDC005349 TaxID=3157037 RepID=UPI0033A346DD
MRTVLTGIRMPRKNSITERWVQSCRHELLDRNTLTWNETHLRHVLHEYEQDYNSHRAHQAVKQAAPLRPLPQPITDPYQIARLDIGRNDRPGGVIHEYRHAAQAARMRISGAVPHVCQDRVRRPVRQNPRRLPRRS